MGKDIEKLSVRSPCVVGNWKMQGSSEMVRDWAKEVIPALKSMEGVEMVVCPPFVYIQMMKELIEASASRLKLGAQNAFEALSGAYTGEISSSMLVDLGCQYVILGHSERRQAGETDALIARKFATSYDAGLIPILCVGETAEERKLGNTLTVVFKQLEAILQTIEANVFEKALIAYEPVWAIGTGLTATPEQAQTVHAAIRGWVAERDLESSKKVRILYGGSVKADNAADLFKQPDIDGGLIGGASLSAKDFLKIGHSALARMSWNKYY